MTTILQQAGLRRRSRLAERPLDQDPQLRDDRRRRDAGGQEGPQIPPQARHRRHHRLAACRLGDLLFVRIQTRRCRGQGRNAWSPTTASTSISTRSDLGKAVEAGQPVAVVHPLCLRRKAGHRRRASATTRQAARIKVAPPPDDKENDRPDRCAILRAQASARCPPRRPASSWRSASRSSSPSSPSGPGVCVWLALSELMPTRIRSVGHGHRAAGQPGRLHRHRGVLPADRRQLRLLRHVRASGPAARSSTSSPPPSSCRKPKARRSRKSRNISKAKTKTANINHVHTLAQTAITAPLDPGFLPAVLFNRDYVERARATGQGRAAGARP